ncbi:hypothetical protein DSO57_1016629 [Entomophthora muscae]|uniref:Uncharacterized protein n=1 Tax=Entomophthora muscae TaxID=34485 RepID=A0ACC2T4Z5_9FUNG|nr:hypothetical protein DSO57_1016629 [Entomophthora muscae]
MNHLIFKAVLTACLGSGGYQPEPELFGPSPEGLVHDYHSDPRQLNSLNTGSFGRYNIHTKVFQWLLVATEFPDLPANVSYNTQGALNEPPLDISNNMDQSDGKFKIWERYQFDLMILHELFLGSNPYMEHVTPLWPSGFPHIVY